MQFKLRDLHLSMRHPFTIAHGTTTLQHNLLVELTEDGVTGYGEGASADAYPQFTAGTMRAALEAAGRQIEGETLDDPARLWERLLPVLGHNRFALCALDEAAHDPVGKTARRAGLEALGPDAARSALERLHHRHRYRRKDGCQDERV